MDLRKVIGSRPLIMVGAGVLLIRDNSLLLQLRTDNRCWGLPGGSMEPGESLEEVAKRELFEEVGVHALQLEFFDVFSGKEYYFRYPNGDEVYNVVAVYICKEFEGEFTLDPNEVAEVRFFAFDELPAQLHSPDVPIIQAFINSQHSRESVRT